MGGLDGGAVAAWLAEFGRAVAEQRDLLTELDAAIGDADHGANLHRGMVAVLADGPAGATPAEVARAAAMRLIGTVGGASGPLYGTFFLRFATAAGPTAELDAAGFGAAFRAGAEGLAARGRAIAGDKTMVDALAPAVAAYEAAVGDGLRAALAAAAEAAEAGRDATVPLVARKGRASYLGERSAGHADPGATSAALLVRAAATALG